MHLYSESPTEVELIARQRLRERQASVAARTAAGRPRRHRRLLAASLRGATDRPDL